MPEGRRDFLWNNQSMLIFFRRSGFHLQGKGKSYWLRGFLTGRSQNRLQRFLAGLKNASNNQFSSVTMTPCILRYFSIDSNDIAKILLIPIPSEFLRHYTMPPTPGVMFCGTLAYVDAQMEMWKHVRHIKQKPAWTTANYNWF